MELKTAIELRSSVRKYKHDTVPVEVLKELVRRAGLAPSVNNAQPWQFIVITKKELLVELKEIVSKKVTGLFEDAPDAEKKVIDAVEHFSTFFSDAAALIAVAQAPYEALIDRVLPSTKLNHEDINRIRNFPNIQSIGAAIQNLLLSAVEFGLGGCWMTGPLVAREEMEKVLGVEAPYTLAAFISVGVPDEHHAHRPRKSVDEIIRVIS